MSQLSHEDYTGKMSDDWSYVDVSGDHLIYEHSSEEKAIELMKYEDVWWLSTSKPNPMRGGMMDLVSHHDFESLDEAFEKLEAYLTGEQDF